MKMILFLLMLSAATTTLPAQVGNVFKGENAEDTIYFVELDTFSISARPLKNYNYSKYEMIVAKVYPYADTAVNLYTELKKVTAGMSKKKEEKQYEKELEEKLRTQFEEKLKNLSRSQGEVLIDIIERNTGQSMYAILKDVKNGGTAFWWQNLGKVYGYDLKDGYHAENNPSLEAIIQAYEERHKKKTSAQ